MWSRVVESAVFFSQARWTVQLFSEAEDAPTSLYPLVQLRRVASESKLTADPQELGGQLIAYLGLENVRSKTGELVDFSLRRADSVKSRSKKFKENDVLFGRLRPELNKVYIAEGPAATGLCSGEFIVLNLDKTKANPRFLRHVLASPFVSRLVSQLRVGASLPRLSSEDLLNIEIPLPPLPIQERWANQLLEVDRRIAAMRRELEELPGRAQEALLSALGTGDESLSLELAT